MIDLSFIDQFLKNPITFLFVIGFAIANLITSRARRTEADADTQKLANKQAAKNMERLDALEITVSRLTAENNNFGQTVAKLKQTDRDQQEQIDKLTKERDSAVDGKTAAETRAATLEVQMAELRQQLENEKTARTALEDRVATLELQVATMTKEREELLKRIETVTQERDALKAENADLRAQLAAAPKPRAKRKTAEMVTAGVAVVTEVSESK